MITLNLATLAITAGLILYARRLLTALADHSDHPQHFGADVGGVGDVADFIHGASN